jgi:peptide/nickel transport system permease protein
MATFIIRRVLAAIPALVLVSILVFLLIRLVPGDVVLKRVAEGGYLSPEDEARIRSELGLDEPLVQQYLTWAGGIVRGDFGDSLWTGQAVLPQILKRMQLSFELAVMAMLLAAVLAIPLGVVAAVKQDTWFDYASRLFAIGGLSLPDFWLGTMLLLFLSLYVGWLPEFGYFPIWEDPSRNLQALVFPALIVGYRYSAISARMTRSAMLEVLREDYVRTARAKGLPERTVVMRHGLRNALIPVITIMGSQLSHLLGGLVVVEVIFALPGMGRLALDAVVDRDYTVLQGTVLVISSIFVVMNLIVDLSYAVIDPRIRYN